MVLLLGVLHGLQILAVHLQEIRQVEIQEILQAALVLPLPQRVHLVQQAVLFQQVYLYLAQLLMSGVHHQHLPVRLLLVLPKGLQEEGRRLSKRRYESRERW